MTAEVLPPAQALAVTTVVTRVRDRAAATPDRVAMRHKELGIWRGIGWAEYWDGVELVGHALLDLGVAEGDRVAVHSENRPEWLYADLGAVAIRAVTVGIYPTNPPAEVEHVLSDSGAVLLVAEDQEQVDKALEVADRLPDLRHIVYLDPRGIRHHYTDPRLMCWDELVERGRAHREAHPGAVAQRSMRATPDDPMTLVYTSGTTGPPKGAVLSVGNVEFTLTALVLGDHLASPPPNDRDLTLSYLPLCHVAERVFTTWFNAAAGVQVNFAESVATVAANWRELQPTIALGAPRVWEKILADVTIRLGSATPVKRANARLWLAVAQRIGTTLSANGGTHTAGTRVLYALGWVFLYRALRTRIGMRRVRFAVSSTAPVAPDVLAFYMGIGVPMQEVYGQTETAAVATANRRGHVRLGTVGEAFPGTGVRVDEETGEIQVRHPGVFTAYFGDPAATAAAFTDDGWLRTGDVGEWVDGTHLKITDRLKDIIITAGGKNISPSEIESALKASPYVREAVVIGDRRPYLVALVGIEPDTVGDWAQRRRIAYTTYRDLTERPEVIELIDGIVADANARFARVAQVKRFTLLSKELDHTDGELTATQKVRRGALVTRYADQVERMYGRTR